MGCIAFIVKYLLFIVNLIFTIVGLVIVGLGVFMLLVLSEAVDALPVLRTASIIIIVIGAVIFLFAFFGCCGAITENRCLLIVFAILMAIFAGVQIYVVVTTQNEFGDVSGTVNEWIDEFFQRPENREMFYALEFVFSCCGTTGPDSYNGVMEFLPPTCCPGFDFGSIDLGNWQNITDIGDIAAGIQVCDRDDAFGGCTENLTGWLDIFVSWLTTGLLIIIAIEVVSLLFAVILTCSITSKANEARKMYY